MVLFTLYFIGVSLSKPHTSGNLVRWFMCKELQWKMGLQHTTTVWYSGSCTNKHNKLTDTSIQVLSKVVHVTVNNNWCSIFGTVVCVTESHELSLLTLHIWLVGSFVSWTITSWVYWRFIFRWPWENGKTRARERRKTQTTEVPVIIEWEVRNRRAMINDTILVGMCSEHHQH